jgi:hypothetical protein
MRIKILYFIFHFKKHILYFGESGNNTFLAKKGMLKIKKAKIK